MPIFPGVNTKTLEPCHSDYRSVIDPSNPTLVWRLLDTRNMRKLSHGFFHGRYVGDVQRIFHVS